EGASVLERLRGALDGGQALFAVPSLERNEPGEVERPHEDWKLPQFRLVENPQPGEQFTEGVEQDGRLDIARVVDGIDCRSVALDIPDPVDGNLDSAQREPEADAEMP